MPLWDYPGRSQPDGLHLVLGFTPGPEPVGEQLPPAPAGDLLAFGHLLSDDGRHRVGTAAVLRAADEDEAVAAVAECAPIGLEAHRWTFGGRR